MFAGLMRRLTNGMVDSLLSRMMQDPYTENITAMVSVFQKLGLRQVVEAGMRAETGKPINRPLGSPVVLSEWSKLLLNPVTLHKLPTQDGVEINATTVIGPRAKRPLELEIPILITGMSFGSALSLKAKVALAKGATMAGTATNSGEAPLVPEERAAARYFIGQYNRGGWMNDPASLSQLDAIEIQLGQGAQAAAPMGTASVQIGEYSRKLHGLQPGQDSQIHTRLPGVDTPADFIALVRKLKDGYGVPVGLKFAASHWLERELAVALEAPVDFVVIDGAEAGTHGGPPTLQDDVGLPTLHALSRAAQFLERRGQKRDVSIIAAGGLTTPGHFLKAMALGADAVYIGSIALVGMMQAQMTKAGPWEPATQMVLYLGKFKEDLHVEKAAEHLAKFLKSCTDEMKLVAYALGKTDLAQFDRSDLVCVDAGLARVLGVDYAGLPPEQQKTGVPAPWAVEPAAREIPADQLFH
ncbi:MAG TPA: FMN-binding glutamate synthase family protein [Symbiobacteriaceae bacterium]|jgi:glutamate synthase domain-containing protein 2